MAGKLNHKDSGLKYWCLSEKALTYFTELVITSNGSDPAPTKTRWVPSKDSTSGSPDSWCQKDTIISHDTTVPRQRGDILYLYGCLSYHSPSISPAHHQRSPEEQHGMTPPILEGRQCTPQVARCYRRWIAIHRCSQRSRTVSRRGYHGLTSPSSASSTTSWTGKCTWTVGPCTRA